MLLGFLAINEHGGPKLLLTGDKHPRKQLLEKMGGTHADKMYVDTKDGKAKHVGYIVAGAWWRIYEVHNWEGKA